MEVRGLGGIIRIMDRLFMILVFFFMVRVSVEGAVICLNIVKGILYW